MNLDALLNPKMPDGVLGVFQATNFTSYSLQLNARDSLELLASEDGEKSFLAKLDSDLREGGLSTHVPNKYTLSDINFRGVSTSLSLGGDLREISKQDRLDLLSKVAQLLVDTYSFKRVTFNNPLNERQRLQYPAQ